MEFKEEFIVIDAPVLEVDIGTEWNLKDLYAHVGNECGGLI